MTVFVHLVAQNAATDEEVFNGLALISHQMNHRGFLSGIGEFDGICPVAELVMLIGGELLEIERAERQVGLECRHTIFLAGYHLQQTVLGDNAAVCRLQILRRVQSKGNLADIPRQREPLILFQQLLHLNLHPLPLVAQGDDGLRHCCLLPGVFQLHYMGRGLQHHALRRLLLHQSVLPQI